MYSDVKTVRRQIKSEHILEKDIKIVILREAEVGEKATERGVTAAAERKQKINEAIINYIDCYTQREKNL